MRATDNTPQCRGNVGLASFSSKANAPAFKVKLENGEIVEKTPVHLIYVTHKRLLFLFDNGLCEGRNYQIK